ncbi:hypothetical protein [Pseudoalteromonas phenolica]|uniref:hypothetical protein n=1 Tax=Pseudoalteromonas phenolica TaxID=161398 RepID=UPI00110A61CA|nr:hypothetical protein [Pseudoalteromonas phenolica]TMO54435.1 hypothetical protein CWC21_15015 [Pseudoalteromonas phenolica]
MPKIVVTSENISEILHLIETWKSKLTWPLLCEEVKVMLGLQDVTRQALSSYKELQDAYTARKQYLREKPVDETPSVDSDVAYWINQVEGLKAELARANETNEKYKQRFVLWQFNAYKHGIRMDSMDDALEMLEQPLTEIKRRTGGS